MVSRLEFSTRDPERALPVLGDFFPGVRMSNPRGDFAFQISSAQTESFSLVHYHLLSPRSSSGVDMTGTLTVGVVQQGGVALSSDRRLMDTTQPWLFPQRPVVGEWDEVTITAMSVSIPDVLRFARQHLGDDSFKLTFNGHSPVDAARGRQWTALVNHTRDSLSDEGSLLRSELVRANAFAHIASMLLSTFPNSFMEALDRRPGASVLPSSIRRAAHYIEENAQLPITIEDIARESRLSIRGLQYAFRTSLDTTPTAYLRRVRLAGARQALQDADPGDGTTVLGVATEWGFLHAGRFAKMYRDAYGVTPRRTLES